MKLLADGGSTKADWLLLDGRRAVTRFQTTGLNPILLTESDIERALRGLSANHNLADVVSEIEFFGAGSIDSAAERMSGCLRRVFKNAQEVTVGSDIIGAARTLCGEREGIACVLGTGSNSCLWDGKAIVRQTPPMGYILGDEGSGAVLGRGLLNAIYKGRLPESVRREFEREYAVTLPDVYRLVYRSPQPNRWLASLAPFIKSHIAMAEVSAFVSEQFTLFLTRNVAPYGRPELPVGFVGSIAFHFRDQLAKALDEAHMLLGDIVRSPLDKVVSECAE